MSLVFLVDAQLPPRLARALRERGHVAAHVAEIGLGAASDKAILAHALHIGAVIVSKDADFVTLGRSAPSLQVLWIRLGNASWSSLERRLMPHLPRIEAALEAGERLIELR